MEDTAGFYKLDGELHYGRNYVLNAHYELHRDQYSTYQLPVDGWYWFDSLEAAQEFFDIKEQSND